MRVGTFFVFASLGLTWFLRILILGGVIVLSKFSNTITYNLRTTLDASGINKLQGELAAVSTKIQQLGDKKILDGKDVDTAISQINKVGTALSKSMNPKTGLLNISDFQKELNGLSLSSLEKSMSRAGVAGNKAFGEIISQVGKMDTSTRSISNFADKIANTFGNTVRWSVTAGLVQTMQNNLGRAVEYVKDLDTSLNNIRIVTGASNDEMRSFANTANDAAQKLGATTTSLTDAAQLYAQNGFSEEDYTRLAQITQKVANVTQQNTATVSEQVTSLMEGYHMSIDEVENSLSGMSVVAAASAADLEELATAEQKVASTASTLGVSQEQLTAQIGTVVSVTRQAPESVGNALRTMYARIADLKMGDTLEDGVSLGKVSKQLSDIGIQVLDETGNLRNLGDVLEELQGKWGDLSNAQQVALGTTLAGKYQLNPFMALMENSDMYQKQLDMMTNSAGALDEQQAIYMDSFTARLNSLQTAGEGVIDSLFDPNDLKPSISALTDILNLIQQIVDSLGGVGTIGTGLAAVSTKVFSTQIGRFATRAATNFSKDKAIKEVDPYETVRMMGGVGEATQHETSADLVRRNYGRQDTMDIEEREKYNKLLENTVQLENQIADAKKAQRDSADALQDYLIKQNDIESLAAKKAITKNPDGSVKVDANVNKYTQSLKNRANLISDVVEKGRNAYAKIATEGYKGSGINKNAGEYFLKSIQSVKGYRKALEDAGLDVDELRQKLRSLGEASPGEEVQAQAKSVEGALEQIQQALTGVQNKYEAISGLAEKAGDDIGVVNQLERKLGSQGEENSAFGDTLDIKDRADRIATLVGSLMQLSFAWQSFQSLGSLWANDDLTAGEKVAQTFENLLFTLPMIVSSISDLRTALAGSKFAESFDNLIDSIKNMNGVMASAREIGSEGFAAIGSAIGAVVTAAKEGATAILALVKPLLPYLAIVGAIGVGVAAFTAHAEAEQKRIEAVAESAERASERLSNIQSAESNFQDLYDKYKIGQASSEDLSNAAETLNGLLDDQSAKALAAAGNWDAYAKSVSNAGKADAEKNANTIQDNVWNAERGYVEAPGLLRSGISKSPVHFNNEEIDNAYNNAGSISAAIGTNGNATFNFVSGTTAEQRIKDLDNMANVFQEAIQEAQDTLDSISDTTSDEYKQAQANLSQLQTDYGNFSTFRSQYSEQEENLKESWDQQTQNLLAQFQGDSKFQYSGGSIDDYKAQVKEQLGSALGHDVADQVVEGFVEGMSGNSDALAQQMGLEDAEDKIREFPQEVQDAINNSELSDEQKIALVGDLDKDSTLEHVNNAIKEIKSSGQLDSITIKTDYKDDLSEANEIESSLGSLFDQFEQNGGFTDSEVADIIQENPEYMAYLTKVGDQWRLNQQALNDYNQSLEQQSDIVDEAMGGTSSFKNYSDLLDSISNSESHPDDSGFDESSINGFASASQDINNSLANGEIGFTDYFNGISDALNNSGALSALDELNGAFDETTDGLEEVASVAATELSDGLIQASKCFMKGETSVSDYIDQLDAGLDAQQELLKSTYDLEDGTDGYVKAADDADQATRDAADAYNDAEDAQKDLTQAAGFADVLQDNSDLLSDYGDTLDEVFSSDKIMSDNRLPQFIDDLTNQFVSFAASSSANMETATQQIADATGQSQQYIGDLLTQATSSDQAQAASAAATLASLTGSSMSSIQALTGAAMSNVSSGISNASQAIGSVLSALGNAIAGFDYSIKATPHIEGGLGIRTDDKGIPTGIDLPTFGFDIHGSGGASVSNFASALQNAGSYFTNAGNQQAAAKALDVSSYYPSGTGPGATASNGRGGGRGGSGGGGGRGGSGGGGGGKSYEPKTKDKVEDEIDRYERVNAELDTLAKQLEAVSDEQDRLAGFEMADNMSKQIGLLQEQIKWEKEKLKIQKDEAKEYRDMLANQYGITYDSEGHIANYADKYKSLLNNLNGLIDQYNADATESGQEALDQQIKDAQDNFDKFKDLVDKYDKLVSDSILESEKDIQDYYDKIEDLQIEAFQKTVDSVDNIKDLQDSLIEFNAVFSGLDSDSPFRKMSTSLEKLKTYWDVNTKSVGAYYDELISRNKEAMKSASEQQKQNLEYQNRVLEAARKQYGKGTLEVGGTGLFDIEMANLNTMLDQINQFEKTGTSTIFGENSGSMYEVAKDIFDSATDLVKDYEGEIDDLHDAILDAIDDIADRMDERLDAFDNINDSLDHYADIIESIQGDKSYDQLNQNSQAMITNNEAAINELKQHIAIWQDLLGSLKEGSEEWKSVNEKINDAQQDILDRTKDTVDELLEVYERGVDKILDKWTQSTGMGDDLDWMSEQWELINRNADYYLDDVNSAYQIQKLQGKYLDLLDNANGLDIQNQITDQMKQQLGYLREKDKLSEYDVQYANAQLEILQKTIALQDAERNKSQMKLKRDTQGNYSYVYKANEDNVRSAQSDLLDAQNNAYNLSKDQMKQTQDDSLSALQDARDTISQIWTNANLTLEEKTKRTQVVIDSLKEYLASTSEQLSTSEKNIINDFLGMCEILTGENADKLKDVYDQIKNGNNDAFDQIDTRWQTSITTWLQNMDDFNASTDAAFKNLVDNFNSHKTQLDELGKTSNMTFDNMSDSIQGAVDKTNALVDSTGAFLNQLKNDSGVVKEYEKNLASMTEKIQNAENGMRAYQEQVNKLQQDLTAKEQENANLQSRVNALEAEKNGGPGGGAGGGAGGAGGGANSDTAWGIAKAIWTYGAASGWGDDPTRSGKLKKAYGDDFAREVQSIINQNYRSNKLVDFGSMKYSSYNLVGYRTGGYTGDDWSASEKQAGKIGLLHEKELILNKTDTENILNAVDMVRSMVALGRNGNYNDLIRQSGNVVDMASVVKPLEGGSGSIYNVECTFPNATNVEEIQRAILTLPDIAPQYAYKY